MERSGWEVTADVTVSEEGRLGMELGWEAQSGTRFFPGD